MSINRFLAATLFATAGAIAASHAADAQTVTRSQGVTIVRGLETPSDGSERSLTRSPSGVAVYRGATPTPVQGDRGPASPDREIITSGRNLWILDPASGEITACSINYDFYGNRVSRCSSN